jgi:hypothetical protein
MKEGKLEDLAKPGSILIFESEAKKLKVKTGDSMVFSVLTDRGVNNTVDVRVCGVAEDMGLMTSFNVFLPQATLNKLDQTNESTTGAILIYLKNMNRIPQDMDLLRKALTANGYTVMDRPKTRPDHLGRRDQLCFLEHQGDRWSDLFTDLRAAHYYRGGDHEHPLDRYS